MNQLSLSARVFGRVLKLARTTADLADARVVDALPRGFAYEANTARRNNARIAEPVGAPGPVVKKLTTKSSMLNVKASAAPATWAELRIPVPAQAPNWM